MELGKNLLPEDYVEPTCPLCMNADAVKRIPLQRVAEKLDEYMGRQDFAAARRHLTFWLAEAESCGDRRGMFGVHSEWMGFCRKMGEGEEAISHAKAAMALLDEVGAESVAAATIYINAATVYQAFSQPTAALPLFEHAKAIYHRELSPTDDRIGGLYNNMALTLVSLGRYGEAYALYKKALEIMAHAENGALEQAITYLNMANAVEVEHGLEKAEAKINQYLDKAADLLDTPSLPRNGYYAFVCEKCAPTFDYYGFFLYANDLKERAREIYERP
ncbi:MAG: tetratricopeptide repeat protein [Oscillospiraceae bacterium]|nr:tetratricopeptide repeat protein [Oscillospiraceae bacterium]MBP3698699.1 tetratricopeptide repeat protein [Oscillospiraceae bacterium]